MLEMICGIGIGIYIGVFTTLIIIILEDKDDEK